jgi:hypothetical protein
MSTSYTTNTSLGKPALNDAAWNVVLNSNFDLIDAAAAFGSLAVAAAESPSATLNVKVSAGFFRKSDGTLVSYAGTATQAVTASATNYVYLTDSGTLTVNTTGFPAATFHVRLATVAAGTSTVTSVADSRVGLVSSGASGGTVYLALSGGTFADAGGVVTLHTGTANGVVVGGAVGEKVAFWGSAPVVQPAGANQAAVTDSTGGTASFTLAAVGVTNTGDVSNTINNNFASLARLQAAMRAALVNAGLMKGSA